MEEKTSVEEHECKLTKHSSQSVLTN
jgi:hypothetical protein